MRVVRTACSATYPRLTVGNLRKQNSGGCSAGLYALVAALAASCSARRSLPVKKACWRRCLQLGGLSTRGLNGSARWLPARVANYDPAMVG